jgi:hypothetical protein
MGAVPSTLVTCHSHSCLTAVTQSEIRAEDREVLRKLCTIQSHYMVRGSGYMGSTHYMVRGRC